LHENAAHDHNGEYVGACVCELIVPSECELECDSETLIMCRKKSTTDSIDSRGGTDLDAHDANASNQRADTEVNHRVLGAIFRRHSVDHEGAKYGDKGDVHEETCWAMSYQLLILKVSQTMRLTWLSCVAKDLVHSVDILVCRCM
jgi:hypothetical protein